MSSVRGRVQRIEMSKSEVPPVDQQLWLGVVELGERREGGHWERESGGP